ncbi:divergent polysaccharide deacetylase family protein [Roseomonas stagni]|uniref:Divergent polysaccharide deacetylase family protein n=1 Tax=Falsiroseomonas algicola TaxID=2716930 RepID=A0A6M1LPX3_9PROT|nr:divergent polysaccharide deacetylase family protein [Falsiroseomonas algicola]NGM22430.1 divergent polysaccharide deacetylase family protein [Falsiroseomonas algicola]
MRVTSRQALAAFWAGLVVTLGAGAITLQWLGPPAAPVAAEQAAPASPDAPADPPPAPTTPAAATTPAMASPAVAEAPAARPAATPVAAPAPTPVTAPEPPPLAAAAPRRAAADPVIPPPDPLLQEPSRHGAPIPKLGPEGRTAIRTYARPFDREDRRPRIGLIVGNMGAFAQHSEEAIRRLPGAVTLAFSPYATRPEPLLERARARGMEVLTALPLEPAGYGRDADPGDRALLTTLPIGENIERLEWALSRTPAQVGAIGALSRMRGERFAQNAELLGQMQQVLTARGLLYIDPRPGAPQPARAIGRVVDVLLDEPSETRGEIERRLAELEALARASTPTSALGLVGNPTPAAVAAILSWASGLEERGAVLAPVTTMLRRPSEQAAQQAPPATPVAAPAR